MTAGDSPILRNRAGAPPEVTGPRPHAQRSQNAPTHLQEELARRALELPGVSESESRVSVPGARAFVLDEATAGGPAEAFQGRSEPRAEAWAQSPAPFRGRGLV
jgi:hypothetical protein